MKRLFKQYILESSENQFWIIIVSVLMLTAIAASVSVYMLPEPVPLAVNNFIAGDIFPKTGEAKEGHLPNMTEDAIKEQMQRAADENNFAFKINARPVFSAKSGEATLRIENPHHNIYPFVVKIFLNETGEEIYNSGGILPNHYINTAKLSKVPPKGEHGATAYIYAYDPYTNEYSGKSAVKLTLSVI